MKQGPPVGSQVAAFGKALGGPTGRVRGGDRARLRMCRVVADLRGCRPLEIRPHGTGGQQQQGQGGRKATRQA